MRDRTKSDAKIAAFELEAAVGEMGPLLERKGRLLRLMHENKELLESSPKEFLSSLPDELWIPINTVLSVDKSSEQTFYRHLHLYPQLKGEWIKWTPESDSPPHKTPERWYFDQMTNNIAVLKKGVAIAQARAGLTPGGKPPEIRNYFKDVHVGDKYTANNAGVMGPNATGNTVHFQQIWNQLQGSLDVAVLAGELGTLRTAMTSEATKPDQHMAIGAVAAAEAAAKDGDGPKALEYLQKAGGWALDVATKIGVNIVSSALKGPLGLDG
jgi:hypothetical protein